MYKLNFPFSVWYNKDNDDLIMIRFDISPLINRSLISSCKLDVFCLKSVNYGSQSWADTLWSLYAFRQWKNVFILYWISFLLLLNRCLSTLPSNRQERTRTLRYTDEQQEEEKTSRSHQCRGKHEPLSVNVQKHRRKGVSLQGSNIIFHN